MTSPQRKGVLDDVFLDLTKIKARSASGQVIASSTGGVPFWGDDPTSWDTVILAGMKLPGIAKVKGRCRRGHERKRIAGKHGATFTFTGDEPMEFDISLKLWTAEHLRTFTTFARQLKSLKPMVSTETNVATTVKDTQQVGYSGSDQTTQFYTVVVDKKVNVKMKGVRANPISIIHPALAVYGVSQVFVVEFGLPEESGPEGSGLFTVSLHCVEYMPNSVRENGGTNTPTTPMNLKPSSLGSGAIAERPASPAQTNSGPGI